MLLGVAPFGMIYGVLAISAGLPPITAQAMSSVLFAGSSQFIAAQLFAQGAPALVMVLTIFVVNLRHALYSASLAPFLQHLPARWKVVLAYLLTDEAYAASIGYYHQFPVFSPPQPDLRHWYLLGAGLGLWSTWQLSTAVGVFVGAQVPASWSLDFTLALTFIAIVVPGLKDRPATTAALVGGVVALAAYGLPYKLGLMVAALAGILAGVWLEARK
jgi:4-azaleucine resistance transporter AzlC